MFQRFRIFAQTTTYLGVAVIVGIWCGVVYLAGEAHTRAYDDGVRQADNLVRVFEAYLARVLGAADGALSTLRDTYERDPERFDITRPLGGMQFQNNIVMQFGVIGADGLAKLSSVRSIRPDERVNESDRDYFKFHANSASDELYVGAPVVGRVTGKLIFHLTRRLTKPDGSFGGVILATIDILELQKFYGSIDVGPGGAISLFGFDSVVRAHYSRDPAANNVVGHSAPQSRMFALYRQSPAGIYWNFENTRPPFENVRRMVAYRVVQGFPLIAVVALAEEDMFRQATLAAQRYDLIALALTACIMGAIMIGAARQAKLLATVAALEQSKRSLEQSKQSLEQTNLRFHAALENMPHGLCMFDKDQILIVCNERYSEMYGLTPDHTKPGTTLRAILEARAAIGNSPRDAEAYLAQCLHKVSRGNVSYAEDELRDGRMFAINHQPMPDGGWVAIHQEITERKRAESQITYMARHDSLTGVANRTVLIEKVEETLRGLQRRGGTFALFILDLDLFKTINDALGHPVGDELLKTVAVRLSACVRDTDILARLGGDEFAIVAQLEGDHREAACAIATTLLEAVAAPFEVDGHQIDIGTSVGIALAPEHGTDAGRLLKNADLALYKAKSDGRNSYRFFEDAMGIEVCTRRALHSDLRHALDNREFELHYQPIVDIKSMDTASVEALIRWRHPQRGMIAPGDFISVAEETSLINPIGEWVLGKACSDAVGWPPHVKVSVNLSPIQFRKLSPIDLFRRALAGSGLPPERLEVEITESVLLQGSKENIEALHELRLMGISIVLDDFGTGYSSLSYLRMFPFDKIKIDRSFVHELSRNDDCAAIVTAVASLGRSMEIATVAEGIETKDQLLLVRAAGCTHAQGYLFGRPCAAAELSFRPFRQRKRKATAA
jgi:diguanylate cyclase (GGDEF)-like protein/PAS domain S-box-containing protein